MRALVVYESMYGNTRDLAAAMADGLSARGATVELVDKEDRNEYLKRALATVSEDYDFILVDCPPSLLKLMKLCWDPDPKLVGFVFVVWCGVNVMAVVRSGSTSRSSGGSPVPFCCWSCLLAGSHGRVEPPT